MGMYDQLEGMDDILDGFAVETFELTDQLNEDLLVLEDGSYDDDLVNRAFRAYHTIKGTAGFLGFTQCTEVAHAAEDVLNNIRSKDLAPNSFIVDVLFQTVDWFNGFITDVQNRTEKEYNIKQLVETVRGILRGDSPEPIADTVAEGAGEIDTIIEEIPQELVDEFFSESSEIQEELNSDLLVLEAFAKTEDFQGSEELINNIFRSFHTLKGNSGIMGLEKMSKVAHKSEDVLNLIRESKLKPNSEIIDVLLNSVDWINTFLGDISEKKPVSHDTVAIFISLDHILNPNGKSKISSPQIQKSTPKPKSASDSGTRQGKSLIKTIRVDVNKLDRLMNLAGELVLSKNRLGQVARNLNMEFGTGETLEDLSGVNGNLGSITTDIQENIMQMRMQPVANVFRKFPRMVRDLSREKNKKIELVIRGEETELDRSVIEAIGDPLVHLLRNALDHGIEEPEVRIKKGKPEIGTIKLSAFSEGNFIVIEIVDDGAGIDKDVLLKKALEKEVITPTEAESLSTKDIVNLIFKPGFSTAKKVTDVSGRGVGMDVVKSNIVKLNGTVDIKTEKGKGSTFSIKLPLTLTIISGMVVQIYSELYIIPLNMIAETIKLDKEAIYSIKNQKVIKLRDSVLPLVWLDKILGAKKTDTKSNEMFVVVVSSGEHQIGLVVTKLMGQEETVVKSLGKALGNIPHLSGATIRGDGKVCIILDVPEIIQSLFGTE